MSWSSTAPDGAQSVKANRSILAGNTTYIENTMENEPNDTTNTDAIKDNYWNVDANLDGRHRYINQPAYTIAGVIADPVIGASCQSVSYTKTKTAAESVAQQDVQPFFRNAGGIMQMLGIRACIVWDWNAGTPTSPTVQYSHNCTIDGAGLSSSPRTFVINFTVALPSVNYLALADSIGNASSQCEIHPLKGTVISDSKTASMMKFEIENSSTGKNPLQAWIVFFGG